MVCLKDTEVEKQAYGYQFSIERVEYEITHHV